MISFMCKPCLFSAGWAWTDGTPTEYVNWSEGEPSDPDGSEGENCVEMYMFNGKWNDVWCSAQNGYICKTQRGTYLHTVSIA